jgi:hypothetical protein
MHNYVGAKSNSKGVHSHKWFNNINEILVNMHAVNILNENLYRQYLHFALCTQHFLFTLNDINTASVSAGN